MDGIGRSDVFGYDRVHLAHVQRAVVGQVEVAVTLVVALKLPGDLQDVGQVLESLLPPIGRSNLAPPDVGFNIGLPLVELIGGREQNGEMRLHGVGGVGRVPDVQQVALTHQPRFPPR